MVSGRARDTQGWVSSLCVQFDSLPGRFCSLNLLILDRKCSKWCSVAWPRIFRLIRRSQRGCLTHRSMARRAMRLLVLWAVVCLILAPRAVFCESDDDVDPDLKPIKVRSRRRRLSRRLWSFQTVL